MAAKTGPAGSKPQWAFRNRLRRSAFGWRGSKSAITRIEEALLQAGRRAAACNGYAIAANQATSRLATYRAIAKKYPEIDPDCER